MIPRAMMGKKVKAVVVISIIGFQIWLLHAFFADRPTPNYSVATYNEQYNVAVMIQATSKKYFQLGLELTHSIAAHFLKKHNLTIILFTDQQVSDDQRVLSRGTLVIKQTPPVEWPFATLLRFRLMTAIMPELEQFDYIYWLDADTMVVSEVDETVFFEYVVAEHPHFLRINTSPQDYPYERDPRSTAYVSDDEEPWWYVCGGFWGGQGSSVRKMIEDLNSAIDKDLENGIIAEVWDESHLNRYLLDRREQTRVLDTRYLRPQPPGDLDNIFQLPQYSEAKIIARVKQKHVMMVLPLLDTDWKLLLWFEVLVILFVVGRIPCRLRDRLRQSLNGMTTDHSA